MIRKVANYSTKTAIFLFKLFCIIILIYQLIDITKQYFLYPFHITINVKNDINEYSLPSISICTLSEYCKVKNFTDEIKHTVKYILNLFYWGLKTWRPFMVILTPYIVLGQGIHNVGKVFSLGEVKV